MVPTSVPHLSQPSWTSKFIEKYECSIKKRSVEAFDSHKNMNFLLSGVKTEEIRKGRILVGLRDIWRVLLDILPLQDQWQNVEKRKEDGVYKTKFIGGTQDDDCNKGKCGRFVAK